MKRILLAMALSTAIAPAHAGYVDACQVMRDQYDGLTFGPNEVTRAEELCDKMTCNDQEARNECWKTVEKRSVEWVQKHGGVCWDNDEPKPCDQVSPKESKHYPHLALSAEVISHYARTLNQTEQTVRNIITKMNEIADEDIGGDLVKQDMTRECHASRVEKYHSKDSQKIISDIMTRCLQQVDRSYGDAWILWKRASSMTKRLCVARITAGDRKSALDYDTSQYYLLLDQCLEDMIVARRSEGMFYLLLCGYPLTECRTTSLGPYYTAQACVWWETELNRGIIKNEKELLNKGTNGPYGPHYTCVNENGEIAHANIEGCTFGRSSALGDDGTGDGKAAGVICPAPSVVHGHPDLLDGPPVTQPTMHFGPRTCFDAEYHQKPCTETSPEGNGDLGP